MNANRMGLGLALTSLIAVGLYALSPSPKAQAAPEAGAAAKADVGQPAPDFALKDTFGKDFKLSEFKGKIVVIEWLNPGCPVSRGCHDKKTMQDTYKKFAEKAVWLGIDSTARNKAEDDRVYAAQMAMAYPILMDSDGKVGHTYGATNTPHMFVVDKEGKLAYAGAIDDQASTNYVADAIQSLVDGKPVAKSRTKPYGCGIHYKK
jgi:peroxiredoxin